jgi:hypothetical protein
VANCVRAFAFLVPFLLYYKTLKLHIVADTGELVVSAVTLSYSPRISSFWVLLNWYISMRSRLTRRLWLQILPFYFSDLLKLNLLNAIIAALGSLYMALLCEQILLLESPNPGNLVGSLDSLFRVYRSLCYNRLFRLRTFLHELSSLGVRDSSISFPPTSVAIDIFHLSSVAMV